MYNIHNKKHPFLYMGEKNCGFSKVTILVPVLVTYCKTTLGCENTAKDNKSPWYLVVSHKVSVQGGDQVQQQGAHGQGGGRVQQAHGQKNAVFITTKCYRPWPINPF